MIKLEETSCILDCCFNYIFHVLESESQKNCSTFFQWVLECNLLIGEIGSLTYRFIIYVQPLYEQSWNPLKKVQFFCYSLLFLLLLKSNYKYSFLFNFYYLCKSRNKLIIRNIYYISLTINEKMQKNAVKTNNLNVLNETCMNT